MSKTIYNLEKTPTNTTSSVWYANEIWLMDESIQEEVSVLDIETEDGAILFAPIEISQEAILRRLRYTIKKYGEVTEENETEYWISVNRLVAQIEIYAQICAKKYNFTKTEEKVKELASMFIKQLEEIPDGCAETFPYDIIESLKQEYHV